MMIDIPATPMRAVVREMDFNANVNVNTELK